MGAGLVNTTKPIAAEIPVGISSNSAEYKAIDLATFSWSEQEQEAVLYTALLRKYSDAPVPKWKTITYHLSTMH